MVEVSASRVRDKEEVEARRSCNLRSVVLYRMNVSAVIGRKGTIAAPSFRIAGDAITRVRGVLFSADDGVDRDVTPWDVRAGERWTWIGDGMTMIPFFDRGDDDDSGGDDSGGDDDDSSGDDNEGDGGATGEARSTRESVGEECEMGLVDEMEVGVPDVWV
jgi:hypothetical protein